MKELFEIDDFLNNKYITNINICEALGKVAYKLIDYSPEADVLVEKLCVLTLESRNIITVFESHQIGISFWNEDTLVFSYVKDSMTILMAYDSVQNSIHELSSIALSIKSCVSLGNYLYFLGSQMKNKAFASLESSCILPLYTEMEGLLSDHINSLYRFDLKSGDLKCLTAPQLHVTLLAKAVCHQNIAFVAHDVTHIYESEASIYWLDTLEDNSEIEKLIDDSKYKISDLAFADDETLIFIATEGLVSGRNENHDFYKVDVKTKVTTRLTHQYDSCLEIGNLISDAIYKNTQILLTYKQELYFRILKDKNTLICKINQNGLIETCYKREGTIDAFGFYENNLVYVGTDPQNYHDLFITDYKRETKLTDYNQWLTSKVKIMPEYVSFYDDEGNEIEGWVLRPANYESDMLYPGILKIHGGPKMFYGDLLSHEDQFLVSKGFYVMYCNPRGSAGKGNQFADIRGDFAKKAYKDVMGFMNTVLSRFSNIDKDRLGVMGGSYGGYMVNYIIGKTDLFRAAVSERGMSNLISAFNTSDIGYQYFLDYVGVDKNLWQDKTAYIENSPIFYCDAVKTPTLFIHGKEDKRCNYTESLQMYSALKLLGVETKICVFKDEKHTLSVRGKPMNKRKRLNEIVSWFSNYLIEGASYGNH